MSDKLKSTPEGEILWSRLRKPNVREDGKEEYSIKLGFNENDPDGKKLKDSVPPNCIGTRSKALSKEPGSFSVEFRTIKVPVIKDKDGNILSGDDVPMIESGRAKALYQEFEGKKGKGVNLVAVKLGEYTVFEGKGDPVSEQDIMDKLDSL